MANIELSINVISSNRLLNKAVRRVRPQFSQLIEDVKNIQLVDPIHPEFMLVITDTVEVLEVDDGDGVFILQVGGEHQVSLNPNNDDKLFGYISSMLQLLIERCPFSNPDRLEVKAVFEKWVKRN